MELLYTALPTFMEQCGGDEIKPMYRKFLAPPNLSRLAKDINAHLRQAHLTHAPHASIPTFRVDASFISGVLQFLNDPGISIWKTAEDLNQVFLHSVIDPVIVTLSLKNQHTRVRDGNCTAYRRMYSRPSSHEHAEYQQYDTPLYTDQYMLTQTYKRASDVRNTWNQELDESCT